MSSIIEPLARGATNVAGKVLGVNGNSTSDAAQALRGKDLVKQLALGGGMIGGGAGLAVALVNYLKGLRKENEIYDPSELNDDTLYVKVPEKAAGDGVNKWLLPGVAAAGGVLSAGGAYALTQAVYNLLQKKRRQAILDEAQNEALTVADEEVNKAAAELTAADLVTAFPVAVPLLAAVASGGIAYAALNKTFPTLQRPTSKYPKRVRAVVGGETMEADGVEKDTLKAAAVEDAVERAAREFLLLTVDSLASASGCPSITSEALAKIAHVGLDDAATACHEFGLLTFVDANKGATASAMEKVAAAGLAAHDPLMGPLLTHVAASEFASILPGVFALCSSMDPDSREKAAGLGVLVYETGIRPDLVEKAAAASPALSPEILAQLQELIGQRAGEAGAPAPGSPMTDEADAALTSDAGGEMTGQAESTGNRRGDLSQGQDDFIDQAIADPATLSM